LSKSQRNSVSWNEYYGCLGTPARQAFARAPAPTRAIAPARRYRSPYCDLSKSQRNSVSWNEYYGCLGR
jgi:hypothetical protein